MNNNEVFINKWRIKISVYKNFWRFIDFDFTLGKKWQKWQKWGRMFIFTPEFFFFQGHFIFILFYFSKIQSEFLNF